MVCFNKGMKSKLTQLEKTKAKEWKKAMITISPEHPCVLYCKRWTLKESFEDLVKTQKNNPEYIKSRLKAIEGN